MNRDGLCKVAEEINKELGASIKVNTKSTFAGLMEGITEAVENFEGKAVLSQKSIDFLCEKEVDVPAQIKVKTKKAVVQKPKTVKGKVAGKEKDKYGFIVGSTNNKIASDFSTGKYSMRDVMEKHDSKYTFYSLLKKIESAGFVVTKDKDKKIKISK
jgi:hypothetical protein